MYQQADSRSILTGFAAFHMQDTGQHFINTKEQFAIADIDKRLVYKNLDIVYM